MFLAPTCCPVYLRLRYLLASCANWKLTAEALEGIRPSANLPVHSKKTAAGRTAREESRLKLPFRSSSRSGPALKLAASQPPCRPPASSARRRRCASTAAVCCNCVLEQIRELPCSVAASSRLDSRCARSMTPSSATCWRPTTSASSCTPTTWAPGSSRTSAGCARPRPRSSLRPAAPATARSALFVLHRSECVRLRRRTARAGPAGPWRERGADGQEHDDEALHPPVLRAHRQRGVARHLRVAGRQRGPDLHQGRPQRGAPAAVLQLPARGILLSLCALSFCLVRTTTRQPCSGTD